MLSKVFKVSLLLIFINISISLCKPKKEKEIIKNFKLNIEYSTSNINSEWKKRGEIIFTSKENNTNGKQSYSIVNNDLSEEEQKSLKKLCKNNGNYKLRILAHGNEFVNSINAVS